MTLDESGLNRSSDDGADRASSRGGAFSNRNFGTEAISVFGAPTAPIYSAGQALYAPNTNQIGSARQVQFTARITAF